MTYWCCLVGMLLVISFIGQLGWSTAVTLSAQLACGAMLALAWMAWTGWGRHRFPLPDHRSQQIDLPPDDPPETRMQSARGKAFFGACTIVAFGLLGFVAWLGWSTAFTLSAWFLIVAGYNWVAGSLRRPFARPDTGSDHAKSFGWRKIAVIVAAGLALLVMLANWGPPDEMVVTVLNAQEVDQADEVLTALTALGEEFEAVDRAVQRQATILAEDVELLPTIMQARDTDSLAHLAELAERVGQAIDEQLDRIASLDSGLARLTFNSALHSSSKKALAGIATTHRARYGEQARWVQTAEDRVSEARREARQW